MSILLLNHTLYIKRSAKIENQNDYPQKFE